MNKKQEELLTILIAEDDYINVEDITNRLKCSERTIRNYTKYINNWLNTFSNIYITRKSNLGIKLIDEKKEKNILNQKLRMEIKRVNSNIHTQIEILNLLLISNKAKVTISDICNVLYINKNIAREEINKLANNLKEYNLDLTIKKNSGIVISGDEKNIRIMLVDHICKYIEKFRLNMEDLDIFHIVDIVVSKNIMNMIEEKLNFRFTDTSFRQLMVFFIINIIRIRQGNLLPLSEEYNYDKDNNIIEIIEEIDCKLNTNLAISLNKSEKIFLVSLIYSMNKEGIDKDRLYIDKETEYYTKNIIYLVSKESGINFYEDVLLYDQLAFHINTTLNQLKNNVNIKNPILEEIKGKYYFLFNIVLDVIKNNKYKNITEDEVGYITLYFQVSLERRSRKREDIKRISIVCPHSFGVSTLLKVKIEKRFPNLTIVEIIREEDLNNNKFNENIDFLVALRDYININIPTFITTPLFTKEDENKLTDFISNIKVKETSYNVLNKLMISDYFIQEIDFDDIFEAIKYLATSLHKKHYVKQEYIQSIIDREKICPTCIGNGILLPHGDIKFVKQSIFCFARLKKPIQLENGQVISIIIMLPYKNDDREEFRELFKEIDLLIDDNEMIKQLNGCNIKDIKHILI